MNIILIAPPAAGKGTEAQKLQKEYNIPHISAGNLLRRAMKINNSLSKEIEKDIAQGDFVRDEIVIKLIEERIKNDDCKNGFILDGFPRNITQAQKYENLLEKLDSKDNYVFVIDMNKEIAQSRIKGRRSCPKCGRVYNIDFKPLSPIEENLCDDCKVELIKRSDDTAITLEERYKTYLEETAPLIKFYEEKLLTHHIDGNVDIDYTHKQIKRILDN